MVRSKANQERSRPPDRGGPNPIPLVLIDDHRWLREGLSELLQSQADFRLLAIQSHGTEVVATIREARPRVVLMGHGLDAVDGLRLAAELHRIVPEAKLIITGLDSPHDEIADFVKAGASGFIMKDASLEEFLDTVRAAAAGAYVLPTELTASLFLQISRHGSDRGPSRALGSARLTARERQVIDLICEGLNNKDIATTLDIALHTVKTHVHNVLEKLSLRSRLEVATLARNDTSLPAPPISAEEPLDRTR
jgi:DNA-binding NarL/FixJ family response regulator